MTQFQHLLLTRKELLAPSRRDHGAEDVGDCPARIRMPASRKVPETSALHSFF